MTPLQRGFERTASEKIHEGAVIAVYRERFRHADGKEVTRDIVRAPDAVAIVAHDDEHVWLVRQPREAVGEPALLELPAGKLDVDGESPLETAKRELAEEIGKAASEWRHLTTFYVTPGFADEQMHVFLATGLSDGRAHTDEDERIEIVPWPLDRLDEAIDQCHDAKSLVGLLWLRARGDAA
jgi:ADP-ribose pyrophosphatase